MQHYHRFAAASYALNDEPAVLGQGDNFVLPLLNGIDYVGYAALFLAALYNLAQERVENNLLVPAAYLLPGKVVLYGEIFVLHIDDFAALRAEGTAENELIVVFVYGKGYAALLVIPPCKRRAPVYDFKPLVAVLADIVAVVAVLVVHNVHAGKVRLVEKGFVSFNLCPAL